MGGDNARTLNLALFLGHPLVPTFGSEQGQLVGTCEYSVECSGVIKCGEFFDYPRKCSFLKDYFTELVVAHHSKLIWRWGGTTE